MSFDDPRDPDAIAFRRRESLRRHQEAAERQANDHAAMMRRAPSVSAPPVAEGERRFSLRALARACLSIGVL